MSDTTTVEMSSDLSQPSAPASATLPEVKRRRQSGLGFFYGYVTVLPLALVLWAAVIVGLIELL